MDQSKEISIHKVKQEEIIEIDDDSTSSDEEYCEIIKTIISPIKRSPNVTNKIVTRNTSHPMKRQRVRIDEVDDQYQYHELVIDIDKKCEPKQSKDRTKPFCLSNDFNTKDKLQCESNLSKGIILKPNTINDHDNKNTNAKVQSHSNQSMQLNDTSKPTPSSILRQLKQSQYAKKDGENSDDSDVENRRLRTIQKQLQDITKPGVNCNNANTMIWQTKWECRKCTYENSNPVQCLMCSTDRFESKARPKRNQFNCPEVTWTHFSYTTSNQDIDNINIFPFVLRRLVWEKRNLISTALKEGLIDDFHNRSNKFYKNKILKEVHFITNSYFKSHLIPEFVDQYSQIFNELIPNGFILRPKYGIATSRIIAFFNSDQGVCDTHFDQDSSVLHVICGSKEVYLAPQSILSNKQNAATTTSNSTIFENLNPFDPKYKTAVTDGWKKVKLGPGDALSLPSKVLHSIKSEKGTLALSFQVVREHEPRKFEGSTVLLRQLVQDMKMNGLRKKPKYIQNKKHMNCKVEEKSNGATKSHDYKIVHQVGNTTIKNTLGNVVSGDSIQKTRQSRRKKRVCGGDPQCNTGFWTDGGTEMYVLLRRNDIHISYEIPYVPIDLKEHLLCMKCLPKYADDLILKNAKDPIIRDCYMYERASLVDYENYAENGASGNLHGMNFEDTCSKSRTKTEVKDED